MVSILDCQSGDWGSIPRRVVLFYFQSVLESRLNGVVVSALGS